LFFENKELLFINYFGYYYLASIKLSREVGLLTRLVLILLATIHSEAVIDTFLKKNNKSVKKQ
jgi:uncharacterized membrane protein